MNEQELYIYSTLTTAAAMGFVFMYIERLDAIRLYNKHGVTVQTLALAGTSEEAQNEFFDIIL